MPTPRTTSGGAPITVIESPARRRSSGLSSKVKADLEAAKAKAKSAAARAKNFAKSAPGEVITGGAVGALAAGALDARIKPIMGKIPASVLLGAAAAYGAVTMEGKKGSLALSGVAVASLTPYLYGIGSNLAAPATTT